jgi:hypothetical protein
MRRAGGAEPGLPGVAPQIALFAVRHMAPHDVLFLRERRSGSAAISNGSRGTSAAGPRPAHPPALRDCGCSVWHRPRVPHAQTGTDIGRRAAVQSASSSMPPRASPMATSTRALALPARVSAYTLWSGWFSLAVMRPFVERRSRTRGRLPSLGGLPAKSTSAWASSA